MKETTKRILSFVLAFVMVLGLMPMLSLNASATGEVSEPAATGSDAPDDVVTDESAEDSGESDLIEVYADAPQTAPGKGEGTTITKKTIYKLVSSLTDGGEYLIVNSNSVGGNNRYALAASTTGIAVTIKAADTLSNAVYIEDKGTALEWTATSSMGSWKFASGDYDLGYNDGLVFNESDNWSYNNNRLSTRISNNNYRYLRYNNNSWSTSNNNSNVYFYQKTEVDILTPAEVDGIYSIAGDPDRVKVAVAEAGGTAELGSVLTFTPDNGGDASTTDTSATATYEVYEDPNGIISEISDNTVSFTGVYGEALVMVSYYVEGAGLVTNYITVVADETNYITPEDGTDDFPEYPNEGAIRFDKNATAVGNFSQSGMAKIELSMTGVPYSVGNEIDVIIMIDMSDSMKNNNVGRVKPARESAINALEAIVKNEDGTINNNRVAVYTFNGYDRSNPQNYANAVDEILSLKSYQNTADKTDTSKLTDAQSDISNWIQDNNTDAGTNYGAALEKCYSVLKSAKEEYPDRKQFVIFVTDGEPTTGFAYETANGGVADDGYDSRYQNGAADKYYTYTEYYSKQMRAAGVEVYSIGIQLTNRNANTILKKIGGNSEGTAYANPTTHADYAQFIDADESADKLIEIFEDIVNAIKEAATNVVVTDKIGSNYDVSFDLPNEGVTESDTSGMTEFYMQVLEYQLDADKERTGTPKVLENFTFDANGFLKSHTVDGVVCENCTHVTVRAGRVIGIDGTYFEYTCAPAADAAGNELLDEMGDVVTEEFLTWKADKLTTTELALEYFVYLNNSAGFDLEEQVPAGTYDTNEYANITYDNYQDNRVQQEYPVPSMTWNGAQVTYVFYLVNENGQPVNRAGREIPFAEAIYVTEPVKESVVWYGENSKTELSAAYLASTIVPDVYALYDPEAYYEIDVYQTEGVDGENGKNYDHFIIEGSDDIANKNTTKVFNTKSGTRYDKYGAYSNTTGTYVSANSGTVYTVTDPTNLDYANTTVAFAVVWQPQLVEDVVVVDYGLDVVIDVATNDAMASGVVGVRADAPANVVINSGTYSAAKADSAEVKLDGVKIGTATVENNTSVRFSLDKDNGMLFSDAAVFYYESDVSYYTKDNVLQTTSMYSSVTVIPATTVYYEDSFVDFSSFTWNDGWVSSEKSLWSTEGTAIDGTQAQDRPGASKISADLDADNIYGFDGAYSAMSLYSNGSAAKATVDYDNYAQASFEFWGTGFDIISLTSNTTGVILVDVEKEVDGAWEEFDNFMVDTYYGYKQIDCHARYESYLATDGNGNYIDGQYEWVRKEILHEANQCDGSCQHADKLPEEIDKGMEVIVEENTWIPCEAENSIYQVPVIKMADQDYAHYRVTVKATYESFFDHVEGSDKYDFYLDAIRIYDPANDGADNEVIEDAYVADHEGWPSYIELRNQLIDAETLGNATAEVEGMVFIDGDAEVDDAQIADYIGYGPNNEVYLASDQSVAFILDTDANVDRVHIGIKSADGMTGTYTIKNVAANGESVNEKAFTVSTATDLYYDLTEWKDGIIVISNTGSEGIISITNIKSTYTKAPTAETSIYMTREAAELVLNAMKPEPVNPFADVQKSEFFYESVLWAVENGITTGISDTHFGPYMYCSRAQAVAFLWRAAGSPEPVSAVNPFADVKETDFFYKAVLWAVENGITKGLTADSFGPNALCNRAQVVTFLWRANGSVVCDAENPFDDVAADAFYCDAVIWAVENGITTGVAANAFDPNGTCMRAHVVTFLYRAYQLPEHSEI